MNIYNNKWIGTEHEGMAVYNSGGVVSVKDSKIISGIILNKFKLNQNYPNPFNPVTMINYQLSMSCDVELSIYNLLGQKVVTLINKKQRPGTYSVEWDGSGFSSGVYLYRLSTGDFVKTKKLVLLK